MPYKIVKVEKCMDCPYWEMKTVRDKNEEVTEEIHKCTACGKVIDSSCLINDTIPKWCPKSESIVF